MKPNFNRSAKANQKMGRNEENFLNLSVPESGSIDYEYFLYEGRKFYCKKGAYHNKPFFSLSTLTFCDVHKELYRMAQVPDEPHLRRLLLHYSTH